MEHQTQKYDSENKTEDSTNTTVNQVLTTNSYAAITLLVTFKSNPVYVEVTTKWNKKIVLHQKNTKPGKPLGLYGNRRIM